MINKQKCDLTHSLSHLRLIDSQQRRAAANVAGLVENLGDRVGTVFASLRAGDRDRIETGIRRILTAAR